MATDGGMIHPTRIELEQFLSGKLPANRDNEIRLHLKDCFFCEELFNNIKSMRGFFDESSRREVPFRAVESANRLFRQKLRNCIIELHPFESQKTSSPSLMAADSERPPVPEIESLGTVYSENPEIVLQIMRDSSKEECYVQVVSDDSSMFQNVLVELPDLGRALVTDQSGRAEIVDSNESELTGLKWQIRLPEAVFELESLDFDNDRAVKISDTVLESEDGDRIRLTLKSDTLTKHIELEILEVNGKADPGPLQFVITVDGVLQSYRLTDNNVVAFDTDGESRRLQIRLYT